MSPSLVKCFAPPWTFFTVNFEAPTLAPPPEDRRIEHVTFSTAGKFEALFQAWRDCRQSKTARHIRVHSLLLDLLLDLLPASRRNHQIDAPSRSWWSIENKIRAKLDQPIDMPLLQHLSSQSQRSIIETCRLATGTTPMKRIKELRLSYARGLLLYSTLNISEIAYRTAYPRVQEFSRDYHQRFAVTPRRDRLHGANYRELRVRTQRERGGSAPTFKKR